MPETLDGFIERVTFHNPENGFAVLRVKVKGRDDLVSVVGNTTSVTAGEHVEASGRWVIDRQHGQQFKADELKTTHPASAEGIEKYLASGAIRSIGPKLAAKIVSVYKERTLDIFENYADMLLHVLDASDPFAHQNKAAVDEVLKDLNLDDRPTLLVWNKADTATADQLRERIDTFGGRALSALTGKGAQGLLDAIERDLFHARQDARSAAQVSG